MKKRKAPANLIGKRRSETAGAPSGQVCGTIISFLVFSAFPRAVFKGPSRQSRKGMIYPLGR